MTCGERDPTGHRRPIVDMYMNRADGSQLHPILTDSHRSVMTRSRARQQIRSDAAGGEHLNGRSYEGTKFQLPK